MKIQSLLIVLMMTLAPAGVYAESHEEAGTTPDSALYGLDVAFDNLALALTSGDKKAEKELEIAEERLAELKEMADKGDLKSAEKAKEQHEKMLSKLELRYKEKVASENSEEFEEELQFEAKFEEHKENVRKLEIEIQGSLNEEQQAALDALIASLGDDIGKVDIQIKIKTEEARVKIRATEGDDALDKVEQPYWQTKAENTQEQARHEIEKSELKIVEFEAKFEEKLAEEIADAAEDARKDKETSDDDDEMDADDDEEEDVDDDFGTSGSKNPQINDGMEGITGQATHDGNETDDEEDEEESDDDEVEDVDNHDGNETDNDDMDDDNDVEEEFENEFEEDADDNILEQYGLSLPEYEKKNLESSKQFLEDAKAALTDSEEMFSQEDYEGSYAFAKFAKKLAQRASDGKYLGLSEEQKQMLKTAKGDELDDDEDKDELDDDDDELDDKEDDNDSGSDDKEDDDHSDSDEEEDDSDDDSSGSGSHDDDIDDGNSGSGNE